MKNRLDRLTYIISLLSKGLYIKTPKIAKELGVSQKIIRSDFNNYLLPFIEDICYDYSKKCYRASTSFLSSTLFSAEELATICMLKAKSSDKYSDDNLTLHVEGLFDRFESLLTHDIYQNCSLEKIDDFKDEIILIRYAIKHHQEIECIYRNKQRILQPMKILNFDEFWYLVNFDKQYEDTRKYHLNSIKNIKLLDSYFEPNKTLLKRFDNAINAWFKPEVEPYIVILQVDKIIARYFLRKPISNTQRVIKTYENGSIDVEVQISDDMEILPTIQRFIPFIGVVEPIELRKKIKDNIDIYLNKFD